MAAIKFIVELPVANPFKFTRDGLTKNQRANFDQRSYGEVINATVMQRNFSQMYETTDFCKFEFYSNFPNSRARIIDCDGAQVGDTLFPGLEVEYRNKVYRSDCKFASIDGKLFIYFESGYKYTDEDFLVTGDSFVLSGRLPAIQATTGDLMTYRIGTGDFATALIVAKVWNPDLQAEGYSTDVDYVLATPVDGVVQIDYNQKPVNLYSQEIDMTGLPDGVYRIKLEFGTGAIFTAMTFTSEPLDIREEHPNTLAMEYRHTGTFNRADRWSYVYADGEYNTLRMPIDFYKFVPSGEVDLDTNDTGIPRMQRAVPFREIIFEALNITSWLADKLNVVFAHDTKVINGYNWENENFGNFELVEQTDIGSYRINLRQKEDRTKYSNEADGNVEAFFDPDEIEDIAFGGDDVQSTFNANVPGLFRFASIPSWIHPDMEEFQNGDVITFTIDANAPLVGRSATLIAVSDDYDGLTASILIQQAYDESVPEFIEVATTLILPGDAGANQDLAVNSSSTWEAINQSGHAFVTDDSDQAAVNISEPTENDGEVARVGVVRVRLVSNPAVFKDINVTQNPFDGLTGLSPALILVTAGGENSVETVEVQAQGTCQWQATSPQWGEIEGENILLWLHFDTAVQTGPAAAFEIRIDAKPPYYPPDGEPRVGTVTFFNVNNPSDAVTLTITQND